MWPEVKMSSVSPRSPERGGGGGRTPHPLRDFFTDLGIQEQKGFSSSHRYTQKSDTRHFTVGATVHREGVGGRGGVTKNSRCHIQSKQY
jgi:hypothetical protein